MKHIKTLIEEMGIDKPIGKEYDNTNYGLLTRLQGNKVKVVGVAIATKGNGCQQISWIKSKEFIEDEENENQEYKE